MLRFRFFLFICLASFFGCDIMPTKEVHNNSVTENNREVLHKNLNKIRSCVSSQTQNLNIKFSYRINKINNSFWDIFSDKEYMGCISCMETKEQKRRLVIEPSLKLDPKEIDCLTDVMLALRFPMAEFRYSFEDVEVQLKVFE